MTKLHEMLNAILAIVINVGVNIEVINTEARNDTTIDSAIYGRSNSKKCENKVLQLQYFCKIKATMLRNQANYKIHILDKLIMLQVCLSTCLFMLTDTNTLFKPEEAVSLSTRLIIQQYLEVQSAHERK